MTEFTSKSHMIARSPGSDKLIKALWYNTMLSHSIYELCSMQIRKERPFSIFSTQISRSGESRALDSPDLCVYINIFGIIPNGERHIF